MMNSEKPNVRDPENWPDEIIRIADQLVPIVIDADKQIIDDDKPEEQYSQPLTLDQWTMKDFAAYFDGCCSSSGIPHVIRYERDTHNVKCIKSDLDVVGRGGNVEIKAFIDWCFENHREVMSKQGVFTLNSILGMMNEYLQTVLDEKQDGQPRYWGSNLGEEMLKEYEKSKTTGLMIIFGIPLTAAFMVNAGFSRDRVTLGLGSRLSELVVDNRKSDIENIARHSINNSPYPLSFPLLDWRTKFMEIWTAYDLSSSVWWRDNDNGGQTYSEYGAFIMPTV